MWSHEGTPICYECLDNLNSRRDRQIAILGGFKPLQGSDPVFSVLDVDRAVGHYEQLGFSTEYHDENYAFREVAQPRIHLALDEHADAHKTSVLCLHVDDADEVATAWRKLV